MSLLLVLATCHGSGSFTDALSLLIFTFKNEPLLTFPSGNALFVCFQSPPAGFGPGSVPIKVLGFSQSR